MNRPIKIAGLALFCAGLFGLSACKDNLNGRTLVRFVYWGDIKEIGILEGLVHDFEKTHPKIKVVPQRVAAGGPSYMEKLQAQFAAGIGPEVMSVSSYYVDALAVSNSLADLAPDAAASAVLGGLKDLYPQIVQDFTFSGKLYAIPRDISPVCAIYYNKNAFKEAGVAFPDKNWTWPEPFLSMAKKLVKKDKDGHVQRYGYVDDWEMADVFLYGLGGTLADNVEHPTKGLLDSPAAIAAYQFRADLIHRWGVQPSDSGLQSFGTVANTAEMFRQGHVAMFYSGVWKVPDFREIKDFEWDVQIFPAHEKTRKRGFGGGGTGYGMNASLKGEQRQAAWELIEHMSSPDSQRRMALAGLVLPSNRVIAISKAFLDGQIPKNKKIFLDAVKDCYARPKTTHWNEYLASGISQSLAMVWLGKETAEKALKESVPKANAKIFGKR